MNKRKILILSLIMVGIVLLGAGTYAYYMIANAYEESPISLVEKGDELEIKTGDDFYFVFKTEEDVKEPNYTYTQTEN